VSAPQRDFSQVAVIPRLPDWRDPLRSDAIPADLIGARIEKFGAAPIECDLEGGGLIIDYVPNGQIDAKRLVLAFNELGMWIVNKMW